MATPSSTRTQLLKGLPPVSTRDARALILGSMPGAASLQACQYYAHPRNRFWPIMGELVGALPVLPYTQRLLRLQQSGIALWDVFDCCERDGSLDSAIRHDTAQTNDFIAFFNGHRRITTVLFNGAKAESGFLRLARVQPDALGLRCIRLPSTSPANASTAPAMKLAAWRAALEETGILARSPLAIAVIPANITSA